MPKTKTTTTKAPPAPTGPAHPRDTINRYAVLVFKLGDTMPKKLWYDDPVDALASAVEYLKQGWQARLSDGAVRYFQSLPREGE
jgi:hypothetical protein